MSPCQVPMELEKESKTEIGGLKGLRCMSNCEDTAFDMEGLQVEEKVKELVKEDVGVDVVGCTDRCGNGKDFVLGGEDDDNTDATEYSSSFGNTFSGNEDGLSDSEVDSLYGDSSNLFDGFDGLFPMRKRKVTNHWSNYISSLAWKAKWAELKVKEMKSKLLKYDRELASYDQRQLQLELGRCISEDCSVKLLPFTGQNHKKEIMKRKKRKKFEDMTDISSYMSHHNLFSYYENKKSDADGASMDEDSAIQVIAADIISNNGLDVSHVCSSLEVRDENSMEHVLWKIDSVQSRVQKLKTQIDMLLTANAGKFSSVESLTDLESENPTSSPRSPTASPNNVDMMPLGASYTQPAHTAECLPRHDMDCPESAVSSYGEAAPLPDIIECSIAPLSEEVRLDQSYFIDSCQNVSGTDSVMNKHIASGLSREATLANYGDNSTKQKVDDKASHIKGVKRNLQLQRQNSYQKHSSLTQVQAEEIVNATVKHVPEVKKEPCETERVSDLPAVKPQEMVKVKEEMVADVSSSAPALKPESSNEATTSRGKSVLKSSFPSEFHGPPTKRKRGERKPSSGSWNADNLSHRSSANPDNDTRSKQPMKQVFS